MQVPCELCGTPTPMTGTRRCNRCWELESRVQADPELTLTILRQTLNDTPTQRLGDLCWIHTENGWRRSRLLAWAIDSEETDAGIILYPVGVIEDTETCEILSVYVTKINFSLSCPISPVESSQHEKCPETDVDT